MQSQSGKALIALSIATAAFAANFSVWVLYAVVSLHLNESMGLTATELGLLLSAPIVTGALLRMPVGLIVEKYSPKKVFIIQMLITIAPLWFLHYATTYLHFIALGLAIGISGVSFTIGIRYVVDWFSAKKQGTAMGIFGAGNAGAAITLIAAPYIIDTFGFSLIGPIYAAGMILILLCFMFIAPDRPRFMALNEDVNWTAHFLVFKQLKIWRFGLYYYFVFGSYLALTLWLPSYYISAYNLSLPKAMALTLLYVASSSLVRAAGGFVADRYGARSVNWTVFWVCLVCLFFLSYPPTTMVIQGVDTDVTISIKVNVWLFTGLMFIIGIAQGFGRASIYRIIYDNYPNQMGSASGLVSMIGALGGCTLPILFGVATDLLGVYSAAFMLLYGVTALCMMLMYIANQQEAHQLRVARAIENNFLTRD